jgi:hypothetical protein
LVSKTKILSYERLFSIPNSLQVWLILGSQPYCVLISNSCTSILYQQNTTNDVGYYIDWSSCFFSFSFCFVLFYFIFILASLAVSLVIKQHTATSLYIHQQSETALLNSHNSSTKYWKIVLFPCPLRDLEESQKSEEKKNGKNDFPIYVTLHNHSRLNILLNLKNQL